MLEHKERLVGNAKLKGSDHGWYSAKTLQAARRVHRKLIMMDLGA